MPGKHALGRFRLVFLLFLPLGWRWALRFGTMLPLPVPQVEIAFVAAGRLSRCPPAGGLFHAVISRLECLSLP